MAVVNGACFADGAFNKFDDRVAPQNLIASDLGIVGYVDHDVFSEHLGKRVQSRVSINRKYLALSCLIASIARSSSTGGCEVRVTIL